MFDLNTYFGRLSHFGKLTNINQIFLRKSDLIECQAQLDSFKLNPGQWRNHFFNILRGLR